MGKLLGCTRMPTRQLAANRKASDLVDAGVRRDDLYLDHGVSGARAFRPAFDKAIAAVEKGDTLVLTILDRLGRSTQNMFGFAEALRGRGSGLRVLIHWTSEQPTSENDWQTLHSSPMKETSSLAYRRKCKRQQASRS